MRSMPMKRNNRWSIDTIDLTTGQQKEQPEESKFISWFKRNWKRLLIIVGIVYVLILSFGIASTRYYTDESGNRKAYQVTFSNLKTEDLFFLQNAFIRKLCQEIFQIYIFKRALLILKNLKIELNVFQIS